MDNFLSILLTLFFVIDALGGIPSYLDILHPFKGKQRRRIIIRELLASLGFFILFFLLGRALTILLQLNSSTVTIAGGVVLFIVALRLIFVSPEKEIGNWHSSYPFLVPIAVPLIASPSFFAVLMVFAESDCPDWIVWKAMVAAWLLSVVIYLLATPILRLLKESGLVALQRFMGLLLTVIAVQKILYGLSNLLNRGL